MANNRREITVDATLSNMDCVLGMIEEGLFKAGCSNKIIRQILVCVEEVYVNVANYAYSEIGSCVVGFETETVSDEKVKAIVEIQDGGTPFNPLEKQDPDITLSAEDRQIGGLGIFMVKKTMDEVFYRYEKENNILTMTKIFEREKMPT